MYDSRREELKKEIRTRLRPVCSHMSDHFFEELVSKVADTELKARSPRLRLDAAEPIPPS